MGEICALSELTTKYGDKVELPDPVIVGPYFDSYNTSVEKGCDARGEVQQVQKFLAKHGFYKGNVDGEFGPMTEESVKKFQEFMGFVQDGVVGPITKQAIRAPRNDSQLDQVDDQDSPTFAKGSTIKWKLCA